MIKLKWLRHFSTIRFSEEYTRTFQLSRQMRSCISLQELTEFVAKNDEAIQQYGKTIALEYFNEFPVSFTYRTMKSELKVFEYVLGLANLSAYEEQLRYANICKLIEYAPWDSRELQRRAHEQQRRILALIQKQPFDLVDALNWILFQRAYISSQLVEHSLHIICNVPLDRSESIMAKMLNAFLKKIEEVEWRSLRKFRPIFEFICYKYEISIESPKLMVSNFQKLTGLKLHLLGYDRVPKAVDQIATKLEGALGSLDLHHLQMAFKCFDDLPAGYNRRLLGLIHRQIIGRIDKDIFYPSSLPLLRLTRKQLQAIMDAFVEKGLYIRNCIYFINSEESQYLFLSQVFKNALTKEFLRPLRTQDNLRVDYTSYISVGRALLDHCQPADPIRPKIIAQLKLVHEAVFKKEENLNLNAQFSLCGWFNLYSLDLEFGIVRDSMRLKEIVEAEVATFLGKKLSSSWKSKKHHQQIREILKKHVNSPFPELRQLIVHLLRSDMMPAASTPTFHSNYHPPYIYMLQDSEHVATYHPLLTSIYGILRGEDALSFIESYIRAPKKSAKLTLSIMEKLWNVNHSPAMMFKLAAGVPLIYFQTGIGDILGGVATIFEDAAIFVKGEDLQQLSIGQLTNLIRFCRKFAKKIRIVSHKLLILALGRVSALTGKVESQIHMELPMELLALTIQLKYSDSEMCIARINEFLHSVQEGRITRPLVLIRLLQAKLMLKASMAIDSGPIHQALHSLVERAVKQGSMLERAKVIVILLKLHAKEEIQLSANQLKLLSEVANNSLDKEELYPSDIPVLLGNIFIDQCELAKQSRLKQLKEVFLHSLGLSVEEPQFYVYLLSFAFKVKAPELIQSSLAYLSVQPLQPSFLVLLVNILKHHTAIYRPEMIQRIMNDTATHFHSFKNHYVDILYYINAACYELPALHTQTCQKLLLQIQKELQAQVKTMMAEKSPEKERLFHLLVKTYKYYWIVIKNKQISKKTLAIFKFNIHHIKEIYQITNFKSFDGISPEIIYMIHLALSPKAFAQSDTPKSQNRTKFFSARKDDNNSKYNEQMRRLQVITSKQPVRSFSLQKQFNDLKINYKQPKGVKETSTIYFTFGEKKAGVQLHYHIRNGQVDHYIFIMTPNMRNNAGLFKGRVALLQQLYTIILNTEVVIYDEVDPFIVSFD